MSSLGPDVMQVATAVSQANLPNEVGVAVLKKAMESQQTIAAGLIQALPQVSAAASEGTLGTRIDVFA